MFKDKLYTITLFYITLPYFIFAFGWLKIHYAFLFAIILFISAYLLLKSTQKDNNFGKKVSRPFKLIIILLILFGWTLLTGLAGIYGYQTTDYYMHNGRLYDLINNSWPLIYNQNQPLVYYFAYYLPSALIGKVLGYYKATFILFLWTYLGIILVTYWIFRILKSKLSLFILILFIFFSGLDALGYVLGHGQLIQGTGINGGRDAIEWWARGQLFLGYNSNTFLYFWTPHQSVIGWLISAVLFYESVYERRVKNSIFLWSLSIFWTPFITIGLTPFLLYWINKAKGKFSKLLSFPNLLGGGAVLLLFSFYYLSGSALKNPQGWIWQKANIFEFWPNLFIFYLLEFGIYWLVVNADLAKWKKEFKDVFLLAIGVLLVLPLYVYGIYNDLLTRASIPALFFIFLSIAYYFQRHKVTVNELLFRNTPVKFLFLLLIIGAFTPMIEISRSLNRPYERRVPISASNYDGQLSSQFLGTTNSFFYQYIAKEHK